ncbi:unnamed protein product, partial [Rangifer tarandus platyrhynchus]
SLTWPLAHDSDPTHGRPWTIRIMERDEIQVESQVNGDRPAEAVRCCSDTVVCKAALKVKGVRFVFSKDDVAAGPGTRPDHRRAFAGPSLMMWERKEKAPTVIGRGAEDSHRAAECACWSGQGRRVVPAGCRCEPRVPLKVAVASLDPLPRHTS